MKPLKRGELRYNGRRIQPERLLKRSKVDLRRLVGRCGCGVVLRGRAALPQPNPFLADVCNGDTSVVECDDCRSEAAADV